MKKTRKPKPAPPPPPPEPEIHPLTSKLEAIVDGLSEEEQVLLLWLLQGTKIAAFTNEQEIRSLLGEPLRCPSGHIGPFYVMAPSASWCPIVDERGRYIEDGQADEAADYSSHRGVLECRHEDHLPVWLHFWAPDGELQRIYEGD